MTIMNIQYIVECLALLREKKPLVVNITNYVVMNNTANALLALGASPIMAHSQQEMAEMMSFSGALVINIGTLLVRRLLTFSFSFPLSGIHAVIKLTRSL